ncbi:MAG: SPFH domain-containing protein [Bacteroidota bacterium]
MRNYLIALVVLLAIVSIYQLTRKEESQQVNTPIEKVIAKPNFDRVHQNQLVGIRLGDGVPLNLDISVRWAIEDTTLFLNQFESADQYNQLILKARMIELAGGIAYNFPSVDSVFIPHRKDFMDDIKNALTRELTDDNIQIKEIIFTKIDFPASYTEAMEKAGLQRQELERVRQQNVIDLEEALAERKKAEAEGKIAIARAEADGRLQRIQAKTEESRRASELAKAETQAALDRKRAEAEVERKKLLAQAEVDRKKQLKDLDIQRQKELNELDIAKKRQSEQATLDQQLQFARLCSDNPTFASFLINKELASKVEIAVLPANAGPNVFDNILQQHMPKILAD